MAHAPEVRQAVRAAYVRDRRSIEAAADTGQVPVSTAQRWRAADKDTEHDWDRARAVSRLTGSSQELLVQALLEDYVRLHQATQSALAGEVDKDPMGAAESLSRLADAFTKVMSAVAKASPQLSRLALVAEIIAELTRYVGAHRPEIAGALADVLPAFGREMGRKYG